MHVEGAADGTWGRVHLCGKDLCFCLQGPLLPGLGMHHRSLELLSGIGVTVTSVHSLV